MLNCESGLAICPYCDEFVGSEAVNYGVERLHPRCHEQLGDELYGEDDGTNNRTTN